MLSFQWIFPNKNVSHISIKFTLKLLPYIYRSLATIYRPQMKYNFCPSFKIEHTFQNQFKFQFKIKIIQLKFYIFLSSIQQQQQQKKKKMSAIEFKTKKITRSLAN